MKRILVANRGEIACRNVKAARVLEQISSES
jgi:acetyl/propionyl-CoA carboxylase alpha subunit